MQIREFDFKNDYHVICKWWRDHNWMCVPKDCLPKTGYMIDNVCAGFLYKTDSKIAWMEYIISNKDSNKDERNQGLDMLITKISDVAKESDYKILYTSVMHPKLIERYNKHEFVVTDKDMSNMIRRL